MHPPGVRIHGNEAAADLGDLHERPDAGWLRSVLRRDPNDVAQVENIGHRFGSGAAGGLGPFDLVERNLDGVALLSEAAVGPAVRTQTNRGLGSVGLQHHAEPPRLQVGWNFNR